MKPFFSIIVPTRNRPELIKEVIRSVILQGFDDYELIISDNGSDIETKGIVSVFLADPRVRYIKPKNELNMPDHWEFASMHATGKYVFILTDRSLFRVGALKKIAEIVEAHAAQGVEAYSWPHIIFDRATNFTRSVAQSSGGVVMSNSRDLIKQYAQEFYLDWHFPLLPNACYSHELAARIRAKHGRLFFAIAPDGTSDMLFLYYTDRIAGISEPMMISQSIPNSNGAAALIRGPEAYYATLNLPNLYRHVPIKANSIQSLNFDDFLEMRLMVGKEPIEANVNWANYFLRCYEEMIYFGRNGYIRKRKKEFMDAWESALATFSLEIQSKVKKQMRGKKMRAYIKAFLADNPATPLLRTIQSSLQYGSARKHYSGALEAAGFKM